MNFVRTSAVAGVTET